MHSIHSFSAQGIFTEGLLCAARNPNRIPALGGVRQYISDVSGAYLRAGGKIQRARGERVGASGALLRGSPRTNAPKFLEKMILIEILVLGIMRDPVFSLLCNGIE